MEIKTKFDIGNRVIIDSDRSLVATVLGINVYGNGANISYDLGWIHNGQSSTATIAEWRIDQWDA